MMLSGHKQHVCRILDKSNHDNSFLTKCCNTENFVLFSKSHFQLFTHFLKNVFLSAEFSKKLYACSILTNDIMCIVASSYFINLMSFDSNVVMDKNQLGWNILINILIEGSHQQNVFLSAKFAQNLKACCILTTDIIYIVASAYFINLMSFDSNVVIETFSPTNSLKVLSNRLSRNLAHWWFVNTVNDILSLSTFYLLTSSTWCHLIPRKKPVGTNILTNKLIEGSQQQTFPKLGTLMVCEQNQWYS